jgi:hypothetical protein
VSPRAEEDSVRPRLLFGRSFRDRGASFYLRAACAIARPLNCTVRQHAMALSRDGLIWNRAVLEAGGPSPGRGDTALAGLMRFHGLAMNGGIVHALEVLSPAEFDAAITGFGYFDLAEVASVLGATRFARHNESRLEELERRYGSLVLTGPEKIGPSRG